MASPGNLSAIPLNTPGDNPFTPSTYVSARVLAANVAESITVPPLAAYVLLAGTADFYVNYSGAAAVPAADIDDGTASELIKVSASAQWRGVKGLASISVVSAGTAIVTASFFTL